LKPLNCVYRLLIFLEKWLAFMNMLDSRDIGLIIFRNPCIIHAPNFLITKIVTKSVYWATEYKLWKSNP